MKILMVEDEPQLAAQVQRALVRAGHEVAHADSGPGGLERARAEHFDLVLLDVNLPGCSGFEVLHALRDGGLPVRVMMLTSQGEVEDRVAGLRSGADDYLTKPFAVEELLARVEVLGRRGGRVEGARVLELGGLCLDLEKRRVTQRGERVELSPRELEVLQIFLREPGRTFSRDEICERVWEREHEYDTRTVEVFVMRLRKKIDLARCGLKIATVRGVGYVLTEKE